MGFPNINDLLKSSNRAPTMNQGAQMGNAPGSAGNYAPGANMVPQRHSGGGQTSGIVGIPSRGGEPPRGMGQPFHTTGAPPQNAPVTPGAVSMKALGAASPKGANTSRMHSLALGGLKHAMAAHPQHAKAINQMMKASRDHLGSVRKDKMKNQTPTGQVSFGQLGGSGTGIAGNGVPSAGVNAPGQNPMGMATLPDEM